MNSCEYYQELISTLVDGELSGEESEALMLHLNSCSRCNAMYAVFHDLSDILSEEPEPLPEGLHENIMAGVRRSELMKKNRRMRRIGLRTAMTAAACAVLVLFAAAGFGPGRRADSVSVRNAEEIKAMTQTSAPAVESSAPDLYAAPAATLAPAWTPAPAPVQTAAPADLYNSAAYTPVQPEQYDFYYTEEYNAPVWTPVPAQPAAPIWTPEPVNTPAPVPIQPDFPAQPAAPMLTQQEIPDAQSPAAKAEAPEISSSLMQAPAAVQNTEDTAAQRQTSEQPQSFSTEETEEEPTMFSFFSGMMNMFDAAPPEQLVESKLSTPPAAMEAALDALPDDGEAENSAPVLSGIPLEVTAEASSAPVVREERVNVYGNDARSRLLAMIGKQEDSLPQEAELTRLVHVSFVPEDAYGSEETMEISIYGDFVYCSLHPVEGGTVTYRADCSLKDLDSFLNACRETPTPSAAPTPDPYTVETPAPPAAETPIPPPEEASAENTPEA